MSETISVTDAQLKMLMKVAEGDESFFYQGGADILNQETLRKTLHEQLEQMALIERCYVDPRNPAHRIKARKVARMAFEVEIYMRWRQCWMLTGAGGKIIASRLMHNRSAEPYCGVDVK